MTILEAKLASVPEVEDVSEHPTQGQQEQGQEQPPQGQQEQQQGGQQESQSGEGVQSETTSTAIVPASHQIKVQDHPDYKPFFKLLRIGAPLPHVQSKVMAAGLDPTFLEKEPNDMVEYEGRKEGEGGEGE